jgi:hypothetical protein
MHNRRNTQYPVISQGRVCHEIWTNIHQYEADSITQYIVTTGSLGCYVDVRHESTGTRAKRDENRYSNGA